MTVVLQSFHDAPPAWIKTCLASVRAWAAGAGFSYRFENDSFFERLPDRLRAKTAARPMIAADLARLHWLDAVTREEARPAIWLDADVLVCEPEGLTAALDLSAGYLLGREAWVQPDRRGRPKVYRGVHNALYAAAPGNAFVPFHIDAATRILDRHDGPAMVPQLIGPKLLGALDNMIGLPATPAVNMASPLLLAGLATGGKPGDIPGGGPALDAFRAAVPVWPAAFNLCQSYRGRDADGVVIDDALMDRAVAALRPGSSV